MDIEKKAKVFKAIGDVTRLRILSILPDAPTCSEMYNVCELVQELGGSQPNMSRHLRVLKEAGLVRSRKACASVYYWRIPEAFNEVRDQIERLGTWK
jgi:ArsR family transcriptional regulator, arsenate/arsenite/antimonite-responsive transcriptional repressor